MKSKKIIVSIVVCLVIAIIAVFVVPSSSSYLSEVTVSGEKRKVILSIKYLLYLINLKMLIL